MRKIEPGMLCLIIGGYAQGQSCTAVRKVSYGELIPEIGKVYHSSNESVCWLVRGPHLLANLPYGKVDLGGWACVTETNLLPIQPDQQLHMTEVKKLKVPHDVRELTAT